MSNYTQSTNFATKDALSPGDPLKIVRGTEINTEFANIAVAVATKLDTTALAAPGPIGATTPSTINATTVTASGNVQMASQNDGQLAGLRNKIINGNFVVNQRGITTVTPANTDYTLDRWLSGLSVAAKYSVSVNALTSSEVANGASGSALVITSLSNYAVGTSDQLGVLQRIEGYNIADLAWGTANAKTVTLSFYVKSSLTGTFGGSIRNSAGTRSYPFTYSIPAASTLTRISVTIPGDTTGAFTDWLTTTGIGVIVTFSLGAGTTFSGTAGAWAATNYITATGAVSVVGTNAATLILYNVQLEVGPVATPFEQRPIGMELALCQRYFERVFMYPTVSTNPTGQLFEATTTSVAYGRVPLQAQKRAIPTVTVSGTAPTMQQGTGVTAAIGAITGLDVYGGIQVAASTTFTTAGINHFVGVVNSTALDFSAEL